MWILFCEHKGVYSCISMFTTAVRKCTLYPERWDSVVCLCLMLLMAEVGTLLTFGVSNPCSASHVYCGNSTVTHTGVSRQLSFGMKTWPQWEKIKVTSIFLWVLRAAAGVTAECISWLLGCCSAYRDVDYFTYFLKWPPDSNNFWLIHSSWGPRINLLSSMILMLS